MAVDEKIMDQGDSESDTISAPQKDENPEASFTRLAWRNRLANKLLLLIVLAVLVAQVLIFVPSIANMRVRWIESRLDIVESVSEILMASGSMDIPQEVQDKVLITTGTKAVALRRAEASHLLAMNEMPQTIDQVIDYNNISEAAAIWDAFATLFGGGNQTLRIYGALSPE